MSTKHWKWQIAIATVVLVVLDLALVAVIMKVVEDL